MHQASSDAAQEAKKILAGNAAIRQALNSAEARQVLKALQSKDSGQLQSAAQAALKGDSRALQGLLGELSHSSEAGAAMERLGRIMEQNQKGNT